MRLRGSRADETGGRWPGRDFGWIRRAERRLMLTAGRAGSIPRGRAVRKVTFGGANSLDDYLARPDHAVDWLRWGDEAAAAMADFWDTIDTVCHATRAPRPRRHVPSGSSPGARRQPRLRPGAREMALRVAAELPNAHHRHRQDPRQDGGRRFARADHQVRQVVGQSGCLAEYDRRHAKNLPCFGKKGPRELFPRGFHYRTSLRYGSSPPCSVAFANSASTALAWLISSDSGAAPIRFASWSVNIGPLASPGGETSAWRLSVAKFRASGCCPASGATSGCRRGSPLSVYGRE